MIRKLKNSFGISFIELLFTISILCILMVTISPLLLNINKINKKSESLYKATMLAQSYMENIKGSDAILPGETIHNIDDIQVKIHITEIKKYKYGTYKIIIEIYRQDELLERLEGYKMNIQ